LDHAEGISILKVKSAVQMKLQFFFNMPCNYTINFKGEKQVAMKTTGYEKLCATVMLCITASGNKLPVKQKKNVRRKFLQIGNSSSPKKCMDDIRFNGRLAWMCVGMSAGVLSEHRMCLQWMHFKAISPVEPEVG
jgi:hypothetical protein